MLNPKTRIEAHNTAVAASAYRGEAYPDMTATGFVRRRLADKRNGLRRLRREYAETRFNVYLANAGWQFANGASRGALLNECKAAKRRLREQCAEVEAWLETVRALSPR